MPRSFFALFESGGELLHPVHPQDFARAVSGIVPHEGTPPRRKARFAHFHQKTLQLHKGVPPQTLQFGEDFVMRWQAVNVGALPRDLVRRQRTLRIVKILLPAAVLGNGEMARNPSVRHALPAGREIDGREIDGSSKK